MARGAARGIERWTERGVERWTLLRGDERRICDVASAARKARLESSVIAMVTVRFMVQDLVTALSCNPDAASHLATSMDQIGA